jgi:hypothetical protein
MRPVLQNVLERSGKPYWRAVPESEHGAIAAAGRELLADEPVIRPELGRRLARRWAQHDPQLLGMIAAAQLPVVQLPPRGLWRRDGGAVLALADAHLGRPLDPAAEPDELIRRYLAAFGPATPADIRAWSGLAGLQDALARLRPSLAAYEDERGRELLDVPGAPLPDPDTPAPVRFLPEFDNVLVAHADRARVIPPEHDAWMRRNLGRPPLLVDGFVRGTWRIDGDWIAVEPFAPLSAADAAAVAGEAERLRAFLGS